MEYLYDMLQKCCFLFQVLKHIAAISTKAYRPTNLTMKTVVDTMINSKIPNVTLTFKKKD